MLSNRLCRLNAVSLWLASSSGQLLYIVKIMPIQAVYVIEWRFGLSRQPKTDRLLICVVCFVFSAKSANWYVSMCTAPLTERQWRSQDFSTRGAWGGPEHFLVGPLVIGHGPWGLKCGQVFGMKITKLIITKRKKMKQFFKVRNSRFAKNNERKKIACVLRALFASFFYWKRQKILRFYAYNNAR